MNLVALSLTQYYEAYAEHPIVFGSEKFITLNADKAQDIVALSLINDKQKHVAGMIIGQRDSNTFACPFSAPFGEICCDESISIETLQIFFREVKAWLAGRTLHLVLPPTVYNDNLVSKIVAAALPVTRNAYFDLSYHYETERVVDFKTHLHRSARYNFNRAQRTDFVFHETDDLARAYEVIRINREQRGYYLSMSLQQVLDTAERAVHVDAFVLSHGDVDVASALVFAVAPHVVQVVYWGDNPEYSHLHAMNVLPYRIFKHYHNAGVRIVDIGTAHLQNLQPNIPLAAYKESIGCTTTLKPTLEI